MTAFVICTMQTECASILTCEGAEDPEAPADLVKDVVPDAAPALKTALRHIQDVVPPEHPACSPCCVSDPQRTSLRQTSSAAVRQSLLAWLLRQLSAEAGFSQEHKSFYRDLCYVEAQPAIKGATEQVDSLPCEDEVDKAEGEDDGRDGRIGHDHDEHEHGRPDLTPVADAVWPHCRHLLPRVLRSCAHACRLPSHAHPLPQVCPGRQNWRTMLKNQRPQ